MLVTEIGYFYITPIINNTHHPNNINNTDYHLCSAFDSIGSDLVAINKRSVKEFRPSSKLCKVGVVELGCLTKIKKDTAIKILTLC